MPYTKKSEIICGLSGSSESFMPLHISEIELKWADDNLVKERLQEKGFSNDKALSDITRSDRTTHVYEGGFKIWECCYDLCQLVDAESAGVRGKRVLELGCGAGLPGILCALRGAAHVTFHDFALKCLFLFFFGYDIIVTSETIYNTDDYEALHDAFDYALSPKGVIWVAAKIFYFGVGGNVPSFIEYVEKRGVFKATMKKTIQSDIPRAIVEIHRS
ncbi:hypothetical protein NECAME_08519 [Necator americanus]|uniref:protein-histidine N-methyltransferase n=1 Tax=Necator americanus TaxID=51031 RepID=W2TH63_NECAM|nr:hypothetical protein NECAME_08519 [Necator americanus]ETN81390.1 hypothetical protein NECAME_08519 [Necator americanus]